MGKKDDKTNVMRILDQKKVDYTYKALDVDFTNLEDVAEAAGEDPKHVFKTLVTVGKTGEYYVFMVPGTYDLDLKKAAKAAGEKKIEMIHLKELLPLTGYVHGGCSPIGMKKPFKTFIHETCLDFDEICFSAGKIGHQVKMKFPDLQKVIKVTPADIARPAE